MPSKLVKKQYQVQGMDCADCALHIEKEIKKIAGIREVGINFITGKLDVGFDNELVSDENINSAVRKAGYVLKQPFAGHPAFYSENKFLLITTLTAGMLVLTGSIILHASQLNLPAIIIILMGIVIGGYPIARKGLIEARGFQLGMNFLMTVAVIGAMIIGEWSEAGTVIFLFALAQLLEARSMDRARRSVAMLMDQKPNVAQVLIDGQWREQAVETVRKGQVVAVKPGAAIPVDGVIIKGKSYVDQSTITGESVPVKLTKGQEVFASSINKSGYLEIRTQREYHNSTFSKIIRLMEEAQAQKAPQQKLVEKFAGYYTPAVIILAMLVASIPPLFFQQTFTDWFYRALVLLVISCPCAFVISTPVTIISGLTNAMRNGILIKGGIYLENFSKLKAIAFDKTGTLTEGSPRVQNVYALNGFSKNQVLTLAASLESKAHHPIAEAIMTHARKQHLVLYDSHETQVIEGNGIEGRIEGKRYFIGNHDLFEKRNCCDESVHDLLTDIEDANHTAVLLGDENSLYAIFSITDTVRETAARAVQKLREYGIEHMILVTGDNHRTAQAVAKSIAIDSYYAELLPADKVTTITNLKREFTSVAMVGDGVNDAPALATADIGIAMGTSGTDAALETADIVLIKDDLLKIPYLKKLSNFTLSVIKQNIFVALTLKFTFLLLALPGWATLWMAVFADMGASLIVIFNGMRVLRNITTL